MNTPTETGSKTSLDKVTEYVVDFTLGGNNDADKDIASTRRLVLLAIKNNPENFLAFARTQLSKWGSGENPRGWVMGAVHTFRDSHIRIDDVNAAAQHIMEAIKIRFEKEIASLS